jgi:DNA helicase IV
MPEYYFNLPPFDDLSPSQQAAVLDDNAIALSGGPGTGKSVVSLWRHILNHQRENPIRSQLLTFTTSLALYLKKCCRTQNADASNYVDSSKNWVFNHATNRAEVIHDEAQDLQLAFNSGIRRHSNKISYGADNGQLITANSKNADGSYNLNVCSPEDNLRVEFPNNSLHTLTRNYRNTRRIMKFAKKVFLGAAISQEIIDSCTTEGEYPRLLISGNDNEKINQTVIQLVTDFAVNETINIGILVPFENPNQFASQTSTAQYYYDLLINNEIDCTMYTNVMGGIQAIKNIHVTTFKSAKGLEFDVVIIPDFNLVNTAFRVIDWRDFYVGVTRSKSNLFLISRADFPNLPSEGINKVIDKVIL